MHKKDIVKEVIEKYIKKGKDFFELTPGYLVTLDELKGFSERTLKRGRTEYKAEHRNILKGKSKASLNLKKKVMKYLYDNPKTSLEQLKKKFASQDKKLVNEAFKLWKQEEKGKPTPVKKKPIIKEDEDAAGSLRQKVFVHLDENPSLTLSKLEKVFTSFNRKTISNYLDQWRKEKSQKVKKISTKQRIHDFLDLNPDSTLKSLKTAFADINPSSIGAYFSLWKSEQSATAKVVKKANAAVKIKPEKVPVDSAYQIIEALKNTIDAQNKTIEILKSQYSMLENSKAFSFPELKGMSKKEIDKFERVMATFLKGLRKS
ncbi:hypothetical protein KJ966_18095 [bacterium]|nr:hypothetical protein [bacterium]